jgi:hypothetical protein
MSLREKIKSLELVGAPLWVHVLYIVLVASGVAGARLWDLLSPDRISDFLPLLMA